MYDEARKVFRDVAPKNLDWPEAVWEAWSAFEQVHGSLEELEDCLDRIERAQKQVNAKRAKVRVLISILAMITHVLGSICAQDAEKAAAAQAELLANTPVAAQASVQVAAEQEAVQMDVDQASSEGTSKRKAEEDAPAESFKKAKIGEQCVVSFAFDADDTAEAAPSSLKRSVSSHTFLFDLTSSFLTVIGRTVPSS